MHISACKQDLGNRAGQEDRFFCETTDQNGIQISTLAVADGMGGHEAGEIAAELAIEAIDSLHNHLANLNEIEWGSIKSEMSRTIEFANQKIADYVSVFPGKEGMGTTLTFAVVIGDELAIGHIGDSRAYLLASDSINQITKDHTAVQDAIDRGVDISAINVGANALMHCLDGTESLKYDIYPGESDNESIKLFDKCVLICSDGLYGVLNEQDIHIAFTKSQGIEEATCNLMDNVIESGPADNTTLSALVSGDYKLFKQNPASAKKSFNAKKTFVIFVVLVGFALIAYILKLSGIIDLASSKDLTFTSSYPVFAMADSTEVKIIEPIIDDTIAQSDIEFRWEILSNANNDLDSYGLQINTIDEADSVINISTYTTDHRQASVFSENRVITFKLENNLFQNGFSYRWQPFKVDTTMSYDLKSNEFNSSDRTGYRFHIGQKDSIIQVSENNE